jgi:aspartate aminotransferase-like enzyme
MWGSHAMEEIFETELIMLPGPVPVIPRILRALSKPVINHRGSEFKQLLERCTAQLQELFCTANDVYILSGSGTCAMEAAIGNFGRDTKFVAIENGKFGERLKELCTLYGEALSVVSRWGTPIDLDGIKAKLEDGAHAVTVVHNETSVGMTNPVYEVSKLCKKFDAMLIMDGVTSIGGIETPIDKWGIDIAITGSQKCLGLPPGLSMISVSERAWDFIERAEKRPYYVDLMQYRKAAQKGQTPYTPALPLFFALEEALKVLEEEGLDARVKRHSVYAESIRAAVREMNIELFPILDTYSAYSNTVTAMNLPSRISFAIIKDEMRKRGIIIGGGQAHLKGKIFRIGHMGNISKGDILNVIEKLEIILLERRIIEEVGRGTLAADNILEKL